ncbi:MAG: alpha-E domain-containing protein, partial [Hyphomonadaceae bacterium]
MLSRAADALYWLARYVERMDSLARLLDAAQRMSGLDTGEDDEWRSALIAAGQDEAFFARHEKADAVSVARYLAFDPENPSSILNCVERARSNGRAMRTALTRDMWDAVNETWLEARALKAEHF